MHPTVAKLFEVFSRYRVSDDFSGCEHCVCEDKSAKLASMPLRELTVKDLDRFAFKAMTTWGDVHDFKYFLPRLFELLLRDFAGYNFPDVLIEKLNYAKWQGWLENEKKAIREFFRFLLEFHLAIPPKSENDDRVLVILDAVSSVTKEVLPHLELVMSQNRLSTAHHIRNIVIEFYEEVMAFKIRGIFLTRSEEFIRWLVSWDVVSFLRYYENHYKSSMTAESPWLFDQIHCMQAALASIENQ